MQSAAPFSYRTRRPTGRKEHGLRRFHTSAGKRLKKAFRTQSAGRRRKEAAGRISGSHDTRHSRQPSRRRVRNGRERIRQYPKACPAPNGERPDMNRAYARRPLRSDIKTGIPQGMPDDTHRCCLTPRTQQPPAGPQGKITVRNRGPGLPVPRVLQVPEPDSPRN